MRRATAFAALALVPIVLAGLPLLVWFVSATLAPGGSSAAPLAADSLTCSVKGSCGVDEVAVFRMSSTANAQAGTPGGSAYGNVVCCGGVTGLGTSCSGTYDTVLALSGASNAHVATSVGGAYTTEVCLSAPTGTVSCTYGTSCGTGYACLATISGTTNAHVADCDGTGDYTTKVCCSVGEVDCSPGVDTDIDGFNNNVECYLTTDPADACPDVLYTDDAWPLDIDMSKDVSVTGDVFKYRGRIGARPGDANWWQRLDLDQSGDISVTGDVFKFRGKIGQMCT